MLTLTFLGVGSAFAKRNFSSNALVEAWRDSPEAQAAPDEALLIDFGCTGPLALYDLMHKPGFTYLDHEGHINYPAIGRIVVTHTHADHIGGLEELAFVNKHVFAGPDGRPPRPELISSAKVLSTLWEHSLRGGMGASAGGYRRLEDYFSPMPLNPDQLDHASFHLLGRYRITLFRTDHIRMHRKYDWPSFGLFLEDAQSHDAGFFSGDTRFDWAAYATMIERARICFHEVQLVKGPDPVHALLEQLRTLPEFIRRKTWLYHYSDDWTSPKYASVSREFAGFAVPGRRYVLSE